MIRPDKVGCSSAALLIAIASFSSSIFHLPPILCLPARRVSYSTLNLVVEAFAAEDRPAPAYDAIQAPPSSHMLPFDMSCRDANAQSRRATEPFVKVDEFFFD